MFRINTRSCSKFVCGAALALCASLALADDSSMSVLTGDSYAFFNNLDFSAGRFNTARAPQTQERNAVVEMPRKAPVLADKPILLAGRPGVTLRSPFRDDTGA
jgi:hypothetical protein